MDMVPTLPGVDSENRFRGCLVKRKAKTTPAFCSDCGKQLTWFTYVDIWENGEYIRLCWECKAARLEKRFEERLANKQGGEQ